MNDEMNGVAPKKLRCPACGGMMWLAVNRADGTPAIKACPVCSPCLTDYEAQSLYLGQLLVELGDYLSEENPKVTPRIMLQGVFFALMATGSMEVAAKLFKFDDEDQTGVKSEAATAE